MAEKQEQQGLLNARERLARISHHFLSDAPTPITDGSAVLRIAVSVDPDAPRDLPVDDLGRVLGLRGRAVNVIDLATGLMSLVRPVPASGHIAGPRYSTDELTDPAAAIRDLDIREDADLLVVVAQRAEPQLPACDLVLLPVPCDPGGMYRAYCRAKTLLRCTPSRMLGVTITGAADRASAESGFDKFARATLRFLGVKPISYAYLTGAADMDQRIAQLASIAGLLLDDRRAGNRTMHVTDGSSLN